MDRRKRVRSDKGFLSEDESGRYESVIIHTTEQPLDASVQHKDIDTAFEERLSRAIEQGLADVEAGRISDDLDGLFARMMEKWSDY